MKLSQTQKSILTYSLLITSIYAKKDSQNKQNDGPKLKVEENNGIRGYSLERHNKPGEYQDALVMDDCDVTLEGVTIDNVEYKGKWTTDKSDVVRTPEGGGIGVTSFKQQENQAKNMKKQRDIDQHPTREKHTSFRKS